MNVNMGLEIEPCGLSRGNTDILKSEFVFTDRVVICKIIFLFQVPFFGDLSKGCWGWKSGGKNSFSALSLSLPKWLERTDSCWLRYINNFKNIRTKILLVCPILKTYVKKIYLITYEWASSCQVQLCLEILMPLHMNMCPDKFSSKHINTFYTNCFKVRMYSFHCAACYFPKII